MRSRRKFLLTSGCLAATALVGPSTVLAEKRATNTKARTEDLGLKRGPVSLYDVNYHTFAGHVDTTFTVSSLANTPGAALLHLAKVAR